MKTFLNINSIRDNSIPGSKLMESYVLKEQGKILSSNDFTDEFRDKLSSLKNYDDTSLINRISSNTNRIISLGSELEAKANKIGYYSSMAVGVADNLRGRGEATEEEFIYRPSASASNSISEEGVATIKRIKGNSIVWNNLSASIAEMAAHRSHLYDFDGVNTFTIKEGKSSSNLALDVTLNKRHSVLGHYYLFIVEGSTVNDIAVFVGSKYPTLSDG